MKTLVRKDLTSPQVGVLAGPAGTGGGLALMPVADDMVSASETAREVAVLRIGVGDPGAVRSERVTGLREVMAKGQYDPDVREVARDVLRELLSDLVG